MNIDELSEMWEKDLPIDELNITKECARIPVIHNKYYNIYIKEVLRLRMLRSKLAELQKDKTEYYNGSMDPAEVISKGWKPNSLRILKADIARYVETDPDIVTMSLKIGYAETIVKYVEDIVKQISNRNFILKNMIEWTKYQNGSG